MGGTATQSANPHSQPSRWAPSFQVFFTRLFMPVLCFADHQNARLPAKITGRFTHL